MREHIEIEEAEAERVIAEACAACEDLPLETFSHRHTQLAEGGPELHEQVIAAMLGCSTGEDNADGLDEDLLV